MESSAAAVPAHRDIAERFLVPGIAIFAATQLATALWMLVAPHSFFRNVGPFGVYNGHFLRDAMTMTAATGLALAASLHWTKLRPGALAVATLTFGLHALNHWYDVDNAHAGSSAGIFDAVSLTLAFVLCAGLLRASMRSADA
jgi:hypothetical protein